MKLYEYQSGTLLAEYGLPVPHGELARDPGEAFRIAERLGGNAVIKAQVLAGGRGKAGGVKVVQSPEEARSVAGTILAMTIHGLPVKMLLVTEAVDIEREFYVSVVVNRGAKRAECVFSAAGGIEIEETAASSPETIRHIPIDPFSGIDGRLLRKELKASFGKKELLDQAVSIIEGMYRLFSEKDCSLVEVNPLVLTRSGRLMAIDAKIIIDDNALIKHPELGGLQNPEEHSRDEIDARSAGLSFVSLDGSIGCMVNGAGLAMATMDLIKHFGADPANFLDVGGSSNPQKVVDALTILMRNRKIRAILMNIFGGITRCDDIAKGILLARKSIEIRVPFVIRLIGTNDTQAREMLTREGFHAYNDLSEAVKKVIEAARKQGQDKGA
jgi:succinyl-CoA synthetase beta subunit